MSFRVQCSGQRTQERRRKSRIAPSPKRIRAPTPDTRHLTPEHSRHLLHSIHHGIPSPCTHMRR